MDSQKSLDIQVSGYPTIRISHPYTWYTVRPRDTRPQAARTLQVHEFELGPKKLELNEFM